MIWRFRFSASDFWWKGVGLRPCRFGSAARPHAVTWRLSTPAKTVNEHTMMIRWWKVSWLNARMRAFRVNRGCQPAQPWATQRRTCRSNGRTQIVALCRGIHQSCTCKQPTPMLIVSESAYSLSEEHSISLVCTTTDPDLRQGSNSEMVKGLNHTTDIINWPCACL